MTQRAEAALSSPTFTSTAAQLFVADIEVSCEFYRGQLGFTVDFVYGEPPFYAQVRRDQALLALRVVGEPVFAGDVREREHLLSASLTVGTADEIRRLYATYHSAGVRFHQELQSEPWGATTFILTDPDGNLILFAGPGE